MTTHRRPGDVLLQAVPEGTLKVAHGRGETVSGEGVQCLQDPKQPVI